MHWLTSPQAPVARRDTLAAVSNPPKATLRLRYMIVLFIIFLSPFERSLRTSLPELGGASRDRTDGLIVANDGVCQYTTFTCLHLEAAYGPKRSNCRRFSSASLFQNSGLPGKLPHSFSGSCIPRMADARRVPTLGMFEESRIQPEPVYKAEPPASFLVP